MAVEALGVVALQGGEKVAEEGTLEDRMAALRLATIESGSRPTRPIH